MITRLLKCVREYKWVSIATPIMALIEVYISTILTYKMADLVDKGVEAGNMEVIKSLGLTLILYALLAMVCGAACSITASVASAGFATNLRHDMYYKIMKFSFSNVDKFSTAGLVTRMTTDVTRVQNAYMFALRMLFRLPANIILAVVMAFRINDRLPWIFVAIIPVLAVGLTLIMMKAMPLFDKMFALFDKMNETIQENVRGMRVVKSFVREEHEKEKFRKVADENKKLSTQAELVVACNGPLMNFCIYACSLALCWFGAQYIVAGNMTKGQLISMMSYVMQILTSLMFLSMLFIIGSQAAASSKRIAEVLKETPDISNCNEPEFELRDGSVSFEHVDFGYGEGKNCISDISFQIKSGSTVGIIGGTGTGKTSIVQLIPRLYDVRNGCVKVGGTDVRNIDIKTLRDGVAMVLQKNVLFEGSVRSNLLWGNPDATDEQLWQALDIACASDFVRNVMTEGLDSRIEQGGSNVSGGQRQRLCIARALVGRPKILILDDSTSAVDTATEASIRKGFNEYIPGTTKIIIAQRMSSVKDADMIIVLDDGRISGIGTHAELLVNNEIYREVYESQTKGGDFDEPEA